MTQRKAPEAKLPGGRPAFFRGKEPRSKAILLRKADIEKLDKMTAHAKASISDVISAAIVRLYETTGSGRLNLARDFAGK